MQIQQVKYPGAESWIIQTYLHLKAAGFPCEFVGELPDEGMICAHRYGFTNTQKPNGKQLFICARDDKFIHPYSQLHVVQNARQTQPFSVAPIWKSQYIPLWPQTGLIPRDPLRASRFENITYLGDPTSLAPELKDPNWAKRLEAIGVNWVIASATGAWNDYREVDAVMAVRSFDQDPHHHKPASKLLNAWLAGVPAILGPESAYRSERKSAEDYLEAGTVEEAIAAIQRLKTDAALRQRIMDNCTLRAQDLQQTALRQRWIGFFEGRALREYDRWCRLSPWQQEAFLEGRRFILHKLDGIQRRRGLELQSS